MANNEFTMRAELVAKALRRHADQLENEYMRRKTDGIIESNDVQLATARKFRDEANMLDGLHPDTPWQVWSHIFTISEREQIAQGHEPKV